MKLWHGMFSITGIVALVLGMTSGIVYADTGTGTIRVEPYPCDRTNTDSDDLAIKLFGGDLDFGTVPPAGNTTVESASPMSLGILAGCAAHGWTVDMHAGPFQAAGSEFSSTTMTLNLATQLYVPDPDAVADLPFRWLMSCSNPVPTDIPALLHPTLATTVGFDANGDAQVALVDARGSTLECSPGTVFPYVQGMGSVSVLWNAALDLTSITLVPGLTYQSVLTVELNPVV